MWLRTVPMAMQGGVLGVRRTLEGAALPVAALMAGPLVEIVFDPLVSGNNRVAAFFVSIVGTGRGIALMYVVLGALTALVTGVGLVRAVQVVASSGAAPSNQAGQKDHDTGGVELLADSLPTEAGRRG